MGVAETAIAAMGQNQRVADLGQISQQGLIVFRINLRARRHFQHLVLAARARGLSRRAVIFKHALRNALLPVMTVGAAQLGALLSGTVIAEKIFERRGLGSLFLEGFFDRDIPVVQGCVLVIAIIYVTVNLIVDLLYVVVDPRVRLS